MHIKKRIAKISWIRGSFTFLFALCILLILTSCFAPINEKMVSQKRDTGVPTVTILSPQDGSYYAELVTIQGKISDDSAASGEVGEISSLSYAIIGPLGTFETSDLSYEEDGSFSFQFATANIDGSAFVIVTAVDWNENIGESSITLKDPGNEIPSFSVTPLNKKVELTWNPVPGAVEYTVHYTTNGTPPSVNYGKKVEDILSAHDEGDPLIIDDLENGNMHVFLLQAHSENPGDLWLSNTEKAIPLSPLTLAPIVTGEYKQIKVKWNPIPATDYFEVLRSTERNGEYINISGITEKTSLVDSAVNEGQVYFYKVRPSFSGSIESDANCSKTSPFTFSEGIELVGIGPAPGPGWAVAVDGNYAYVGYYSGWLYKFDISDPYNPSVINATSLGVPIYDIELDVNYAYIASLMGFFVVDNNTLAPVATTFVGIFYGVELDIVNNHAYVVTWPSGFVYKFNINPYNPVPIGSMMVGGARDVALDSTYLYLANYNTPNMVILQKNTFVLEDIYATSFPNTKISIDGNYAILTGPYGLSVMDISTPLSSSETGTYTSGMFYGMDVSLIGKKAYVANRYNQLILISLFDPVNPFPTAFCDLPGSGMGLAISGNFAYVADYFTGLDVVDISTSTPDNPTKKDPYSPLDARGLAVSGNYAYIASGVSGLQVLDISDPEIIPGDAGSYDTDGTAKAVAVSGNYAFVADGGGDEIGLEIFKISALGIPSPEGLYDTPGDANDVAVIGNYAYVADGVAGLQVIDISFPDNPVRVGFRDMPGGDAKGVALSGNYAFVADGVEGLHVIDISRPSNPIIIETYPCNANDVVINGNYAYVADAAPGLKVVDISFPNNLIDVGFCTIPGTAESVALSGNYAFIAAGAEGLQVIDITSPSSPTRIGKCDIGNAVSLAVTGSYAYVVNEGTGVEVIDLLSTIE